MEQMYSNLPARTKRLINSWNTRTSILKFRAYSLLPVTETGIHYSIERVLTDANRPDLRFALYMITKELAVNAVKANLKVIHFLDHQTSINDVEKYGQILSQFRDLISEDWAARQAEKGKELNLFVEISFNRVDDILNIEVLNSRPITEIELARFENKLRLAMSDTDMSEYAMGGGDSEEGAGMGLLLIVNILKSLELPFESISIKCPNNLATVVTVKIPLGEEK